MYSINEIVKITGIPASTLRYYEQVGILPEVKRNINGRREYNEKILEWLELVMALKDTGMSIEEIKSYTELILQGDETLDIRRRFLTDHKKNVELALAKKQYHLEKIIRKIAVYDVLLHKKKEYSDDYIKSYLT
ncbi:MerR family transcriptional regulator [Paenibacillus urinalis]|uniref:MerR family transcriptional regulator n=1 Tax=Paenibacillus urinalis TaxID=521520 RepID=UPI00196060CD